MRKSHSYISPPTCLSNLGRHALIFDDGEVLELLKTAVEREGNQVAFARRHGLDRVYLNMVLNRKRSVGEKVIKALGLRKVYTTVEISAPQPRTGPAKSGFGHMAVMTRGFYEFPGQLIFWNGLGVGVLSLLF